MSQGQQFFEEDEAQEILRIAARHPLNSGGAQGISRENLLQTAQELGISEEAVRAAESQVQQERTHKGLYAEFVASRRRSFFSSLGTYLIVNTALFALDFSDGRLTWFYWVLFGWGISVAKEALRAFGPDSKIDSPVFRRWVERKHKSAASGQQAL